MDINKLLLLLSDGEYHSGSELGKALDVSRTSVWKSLPLLEKLAIVTETLKGKGYRIPGGLDLLDKNSISKSLPTHISESLDIDILLSHESTNDYLIQLSKQKQFVKYHACLAEMQVSGRGRRGRAWVSPFAKNIYLSLGFTLGAGGEQLSGLSLVVGIAVARTLENLGLQNVGLKWPNDVLVEGKKVAGILIELSGEATTNWNVICGVGLNVSMTKAEGRDIDQDWVSLHDYIDVKRNVVAKELLIQLVEVMEEFKGSAFADFIAQWGRYDVLRGKEVSILPGKMTGRVVGINHQGALLVVDDGQVKAVNAGEVSVRKL